MKKRILASCLALCFSAVTADELADAVKWHENGETARALPVLKKLAEGGNIEAQLQLGDMYGFGDGVAEDPAQATLWLQKAAAKGNKDALSTLQTLEERGKRKAEINYYANNYDGSDVKFSNFNCIEPNIPALSRDKKSLLAVNGEVNAWFDCYDRFTEHMNKSLPPGKAIPAAVVSVMSNAEFTRASKAMDKQYALIGADTQKHAADIRGKYEAWRTATEVSFKQANKEYEELERLQAATRTRRIQIGSGASTGGR